MCTDAPVGRHGRCIAVLIALTCALAPPASAKSAGEITAESGKVSKGAARAAVKAVKRVEREMWREGAKRSRVLGCWRSGETVVDCTGEVGGDDGALTWRCMLKIRVRKRDTEGHKAKLTGAVCVAGEVTESKR